MPRDDEFVDGMPIECGGVAPDGRPLVGVTLASARAKIDEGVTQGRLLAAVWELPNGDVAVALSEPHATTKLVEALRRTADGLARTIRAH